MKKKDIKILLVDDEPDILEIVGYNLSSEGYTVITAENGKQAIKKAKKELPHLVILDVMMPEMDGMEACEKMRNIPELAETIITFLITKPIKPKVLVSKVKALLRRYKETKEETSKIKLGNLVINREEYKIILGKEEMVLPRKEFELLALLASKPGKVFKREVILDRVWGNEVVVGGRTIDVHIRKLREKIGDEKFKTVKGVGYKFVI